MHTLGRERTHDPIGVLQHCYRTSNLCLLHKHHSPCACCLRGSCSCCSSSASASLLQVLSSCCFRHRHLSKLYTFMMFGKPTVACAVSKCFRARQPKTGLAEDMLQRKPWLQHLLMQLISEFNMHRCKLSSAAGSYRQVARAEGETEGTL